MGSHIRARGRTPEAEFQGTHKLAWWRATLPVTPHADAMRVAVDVRGPLGLALVQSYILEPLVSLAAVPRRLRTYAKRRDCAGREGPVADRPFAEPERAAWRRSPWPPGGGYWATTRF